jgi:hypothetical protein
MFNGTTQPISVNSNVSGAEVHLDGQLLGQTPLTVVVHRRKKASFLVTKPGYIPVTLHAHGEFTSAFFWGDVLTGGLGFGLPGLLSTTVDGSNDALYEFEPGNFFADLHQENVPVAQSSKAKQTSQIIRFCLDSFPMLALEIGVGRGEHVEALCELADLQLACADPRFLRRMLAENPTADTFAIAMAKLSK